MTTNRTIDLGSLTGNGAVRNISGRDRGLSARYDFQLDELDILEDVEVAIIVPDYMDTITPSFFQGMLEGSLRRFDMDRNRFNARYHLESSELIARAFERGMRAILTHRDFTQAA